MSREIRIQDRSGKEKDLIIHPIGVQQIIVGDLRERVHPITGELVQVGTTGKIYYDIQDPRENRFLLAFESGKRVKPSNDD